MTLAERLKDEPGYRPYCPACSTMTRMERTPTGFLCNPTTQEPTKLVGDFHIIHGRFGCGNTIEVTL